MIHVADRREEHRAERRARVVGVNHEGGLRRQPLVDVGAARVPRPCAGSADDQHRSALAARPGHRAAEPIVGGLAGQRQQHAAVPAGVDVGAAGTLTAGGVARRADDDVGEAVAVDVADPGHVLAEAVRRVLRRQRQQQTAVLAGVDVGLARTRRAGDYVRNAVAVGVAGRFDAGAKLIAGMSIDFPEQRTGLGRVDIDASGGGAADVLGRRRRHDIRHAVAIDVADDARDPSELIVGRLAVPLANDLDRLDEWLRELFGRRQQRMEAWVRLQRQQVRVGLDLRHVEPPRRLRATKPVECRVGILLQRVGRAKVVEHLRRCRLELQRLSICGERLVELFGALIGDAEQSPCARVAGLARGDRFEDPRRARWILRLQ